MGVLRTTKTKNSDFFIVNQVFAFTRGGGEEEI
jgi:hypothetical protein